MRSLELQNRNALAALMKYHPPKRMPKPKMAPPTDIFHNGLGWHPVLTKEPIIPFQTKSGRILQQVAEVSKISLADLRGSRRQKPLVVARWAAMWLMHKHCPGLSYPYIGQILRRDHSTVMHGIAKVQADPSLCAAVICAVEARL